MTISFSGLSTGIDTNALVDQLVEVELAPARQLETRKSNANRRASIVSDLVTRLKALKSAAATLDTASEVRSVAARSSDEARVKVTSSGAAQPATMTLRVGTLAKAQTTVSALFAGASPEDPVPGAGTLGIQVGSAAAVLLDFNSTDSLAAITQRINDEVDGVHAELMDTGAGLHIAVTSDETGTASALTFTEAGTSLGFLLPDSTKVSAQDASFTLNGIALTRSTNTVGDAIAGVTLELIGTHAAADPDTTVNVTRDPAGLETKIKSLVDSFNSLADVVNGQVSFGGVARGQDTLFGDSTVRALQRALSQLAGNKYPHGDGTVTLSKLGIQLGRDGKLSIDSAALAKAVANDPDAIEDLIAGPDGLAPAIDDLVDQYTRAGDGFLSAKTSSLKSEMSRFDDEIGRIQDRASRIGDQLHAQFTALESLISGFQSQQAALNSLLK